MWPNVTLTHMHQNAFEITAHLPLVAIWVDHVHSEICHEPSSRAVIAFDESFASWFARIADLHEACKRALHMVREFAVTAHAINLKAVYAEAPIGTQSHSS